jgi:hypothetical protein
MYRIASLPTFCDKDGGAVGGEQVKYTGEGNV